MTVLLKARRRIEARILELESRLDAGDESLWTPYLQACWTLAQVATVTSPGHGGELLTTKQLAEQMQISPKALLRRRKNGLITPAAELGKRGRGALRWRAP
jgi:hypothetical protein